MALKRVFVWFLAAFTLLADLGAASAAAAAAHPIIITVPVGVGSAGGNIEGEPGAIDLDIIETPALDTEGVLAPGAVIAQRSARVHYAVVLTEAVVKDSIEIPAGALLVKVDSFRDRDQGSDPAPARTVWCVMRKLTAWGGFLPRLDCLESSRDASVLDRYTTGFLRSDRGDAGGWELYGPAYDGTPLNAPAKYRPATEADLPVVKIGYALCNEPSPDGAPPRFVSAMASPSGVWITGDKKACPFGDWENGKAEGRLKLDAAEIKIDKDHYKVLEPIPLGHLSHFAPGEPLRLASQRSAAQEKAQDAATARPFIPAGPLSVAPPGLLNHGDGLASVQVRHGLTGTLKYDVITKLPFSSERLAAGTYVFGVPMATNGQNLRVTWCAPQLLPTGDVQTSCFQDQGEGRIGRVVATEPMMPIYLPALSNNPFVSNFVVDRKPADFGARMDLTWVFDQWIRLTDPSKTLAAQVGVEVRVNGRMTPIEHVQILPWTDGGYRLPVMGGFILVRPVNKNTGQPIELQAKPANREETDALWGLIAPKKAFASPDGAADTDGALPLLGAVGGPPASERPKDLVTVRCRVTDAPKVSDCQAVSENPIDPTVRQNVVTLAATVQLNPAQRALAAQAGGFFTFKIRTNSAPTFLAKGKEIDWVLMARFPDRWVFVQSPQSRFDQPGSALVFLTVFTPVKTVAGREVTGFSESNPFDCVGHQVKNGVKLLFTPDGQGLNLNQFGVLSDALIDETVNRLKLEVGCNGGAPTTITAVNLAAAMNMAREMVQSLSSDQLNAKVPLTPISPARSATPATK